MKIKLRKGQVILILIFILSMIIILSQPKIYPQDDNIIIINNTIHFDSLTLKQKLAQMIVIYGDDKNNLELTRFSIGGIFSDAQKSKEDYSHLINQYQTESKIRLIVSTDMEGSWNPFSNFKDFPKFSEIKNSEETYLTGLEEGELLKEMGFNLNFAPVSEFEDLSYGGRVFSGTKKEVKEKLMHYIEGLQKNVAGTCKHYPGKGMINNLHNKIDNQNISKEDLELFKICLKNNISSIMIGHQIVLGELDSEGKPSSVSTKLISSLNNFSGLIVSDEINMKGLSTYYTNKAKRYTELINSGENLILDFKTNYRSLSLLLTELEQLVKEGKISEEKINESVKKILIFKGYSIQ